METKDKLQLVTLEQAERLKKLGFDWFSWRAHRVTPEDIERLRQAGFGDRYCQLPDVAPKEIAEYLTVALALKWLREEKHEVGHLYWLFHKFFGVYYFNEIQQYTEKFDTYEQAESALLNALLDLIEKGDVQ